MPATEQQGQLLARFEVARELLTEMRRGVETHRRNCQVMGTQLGVLHCDDQLRRIDDVLNWKAGV